MLHHLSREERQALLSRVHGWLSPGGWFYARDPNARGALRRATGWWFESIVVPQPERSRLDPVRCWSGELVAAGFRTPRIGYTDVLGGPLPWLLRTTSGAFWTTVFTVDRAWLGVPGLRALASQFEISAQP